MRIPEVNENENDRNSQVTFNQNYLRHQSTHKSQAEIDQCDTCKQNQRALAKLSEEKEGHNMHHDGAPDDHDEDEHKHQDNEHKKLLKERQELAIYK